MNEYMQFIHMTYRNNDDLVIRKIRHNEDYIYIVFFESLTNSSDIYEYLIKNIHSSSTLANMIKAPKLISLYDNSKIEFYLENGFAICVYRNEIYAFEAKANIDRGVNISDTEPSMYGPKDAFCENYQKNLGLIKRRVKTKNLKSKNFEFGDMTKTKISLTFIDNMISDNKIKILQNKLDSISKINVIDSDEICKRLEQNKILPTIMKTEKPSIIAKYLLQGYAVILIDNSPFALIIDAKFNDFINPGTTDKFIKVLRYICLALTIITPALYISLINFNQETIPTSLLINFMNQRNGVPFPAIVEAFLMLFICEILRETDIRFPNSYGSSASIVGALILGDAAVSAGLVSPIMIIIIAITFITNLIFTEIKLVSAFRIMRFFLLLISGLFGLYGCTIGILFLLALISNVKMYEGEYL